MGNAEQASNEIIHYLPQHIDALGTTIHMQTMYMSWLACIITIALVWVATAGAKMIPGRAQALLEIIEEWLGGLIEDNLGKDGRRKMEPFLLTLFLFLFVANEVGVFLPSVFGFHFTSPTNDINVVFAFSIMVLVLTYIVGIGRNGLGHFAHFFKPFKVFLPLNLIEEIAKPVTMALRLFGNIVAGEILLIVLYKLSPWVVPDLWILFSLCIGLLQAFVFTMLTIIGLAPVFKHH